MRCTWCSEKFRREVLVVSSYDNLEILYIKSKFFRATVALQILAIFEARTANGSLFFRLIFCTMNLFLCFVRVSCLRTSIATH